MKFLQRFRRESSCRFLVDPEGSTSRKFSHFKELLESNNQALDIIARLEETYYGGAMFSPGGVRQHLTALDGESRRLVAALASLAPGRHGALAGILEQILSRARGYFPDEAPVPKGPLVLPLADAAVQHQELAGGKAANLAVIRNVLGLPVPEGFVVTAAGFARFLAHHHLGDAIRAELDAISPLDPVGLL